MQRLLWLALGAFLAHGLDALDHELKPITSPLGAGGGLFDVGKYVRVVHLLAKLLEERSYFGQDKKHFTANRGLQEQVFVQHTL